MNSTSKKTQRRGATDKLTIAGGFNTPHSTVHRTNTEKISKHVKDRQYCQLFRVYSTQQQKNSFFFSRAQNI